MADKKISQLTAATTPLAGTEVLPIVQSGSTVKVSVDNLTAGKTVKATTFDTDVAAAKVTLSGTTLAASGSDSNININITPKGTGEVALPKVNIDAGTVDGTVIGGSSAAAGTFTSVTGERLVVTGSTVPANGVYLPAANTVGIATNSANEFRVDSSGRLLLGTTSILNYGGDATLARSQTVVRDASTNTVLPVAAFVRRAVGTPAAGIGAEINLVTENAYSGVSNYASVGCVATDLGNISGDLSISTRLNNTMTEQVRVTSAGNVKMINAGKGIDFSANTGAAGETSSLLNWYEEGTWTPAVGAGSGTITTVGTVVGRYTRVGQQVTAIFSVAITTNGTGASYILIQGLPFAPNATPATFSGFGFQNSSGKALSVGSGGSSIYIRLYDATYPASDGEVLYGTLIYNV